MAELEYKSSCLNLFNFSKENKVVLLYALWLFIFPFLIAQQLILGTLVNALLIKSSIDYNSKKVLLLSIIPSLAVFSSGVLFGNLTYHTIYMLPFIWVGNLIIMLVFRKLFAEQKRNYLLTTLLGAGAKTIFLFTIAFILVNQSILPVLFLTAFGMLQFITAILGATIVYFERKAKLALNY